jgi:L-lysine 2,3-aminomutase
MRTLRGDVSGLCQPLYVLDIPGGKGKVPIGPNYLAETGEGTYIVEDYRGGSHRYADSVYRNSESTPTDHGTMIEGRIDDANG